MKRQLFGNRWRTVARRLSGVVLSLGLIGASLVSEIASAQDPAISLPVVAVEEGPASATLRIPADDMAEAWLELTALDQPELPPLVFRLQDRRTAEGDLELSSGQLSDHRVMLCSRARDLAVTCEVVFLEASAEPTEVRFAAGWQLRGRYRFDSWPAAGVRVALVPAGLDSLRPYTLPLGSGTSLRGGLVREVTSDADGVFTMPRIAAGEYLFEAVLPSGRVHRSAPFILPPPDPASTAADGTPAEPQIWELGELDVADQLAVEVRVLDALGLPIVGAMVGGTQGEEPRQVISFQATTDSEGVATLSGFSAERAARLTCQAPGHRRVELRYELIPALVECVLEPLARVSGELVAVDGGVPAGGVVSITPQDEVERSFFESSTRTAPMISDGRFSIAGLMAGAYRLALAAPGYAVELRDLTLEPGEHLELGVLVLLAGRDLVGKVVDAVDGEPLVGVAVEAAIPPGAAFTITDEEGEFRVSTALDEPWVLRFSHPHYAPRAITIDPTIEDETLQVELERGGFIQASVWAEDTARPCQGCRIVIQPGGEELLTDALGVALSSPLAAGFYRVHRPRVDHWGSLVIEQPDAELRHVRVKPSRVSRVSFGQRGATVSVRFAPSPGPGWTLSARSAVHFERYYAQDDGGFEVRRRDRPESLDLFLHRFDPVRQTELEVWQRTLPTDTRAITLELSRTVVEGRAVSPAGPVVGQVVELRTFEAGRLAARTRTSTDGGFQIPHVPPGVYALRIGDRTVKLFSLRSAERLNLQTFELFPGAY